MSTAWIRAQVQVYKCKSHPPDPNTRPAHEVYESRWPRDLTETAQQTRTRHVYEFSNVRVLVQYVFQDLFLVPQSWLGTCAPRHAEAVTHACAIPS